MKTFLAGFTAAALLIGVTAVVYDWATIDAWDSADDPSVHIDPRYDI